MSDKTQEWLGYILGGLVFLLVIAWKNGCFEASHPSPRGAYPPPAVQEPLPSYYQPAPAVGSTPDSWYDLQEGRSSAATADDSLARYLADEQLRAREREIEADRQRWEREKREMDARTAGNPYMR